MPVHLLRLLPLPALLVAGLFLAACTKPDLSKLSAGGGSEDASGLTVATDSGRSPHFAAVARHLQFGGPISFYADLDGDFAYTAEVLQQALNSGTWPVQLPESAKTGLVSAASDLGLTRIRAAGFTSVRAGDLFRNDAFLYLPDGRAGLFAAFGGEARPFEHLAFAPEDADLFFSDDLDGAAFLTTIETVLRRLAPAEALEGLDQALAAPLGPLRLDTRRLISGLRGRVVFYATLVAERTWRMPQTEVDLPSVHFGLMVENGHFLFDPLAEAAASIPMLEKVLEGSTRLLRVRSPQRVGGVDWTLVLRSDGTHLYLFSRAEDWKGSALRSGSHLGENREVRDLLAQLGTEGNSLRYISPRANGAARALVQALEKTLPDNPTIAWFRASLPAQDRALISLRVNRPDGILFRSLWPTSYKSNLSVAGLANPALLGPIAQALQQRSGELLGVSPGTPRPAPSGRVTRVPPPLRAEETPVAETAPTDPNSKREQTAAAIRANLARIAAAADTYLTETGAEAVRVADLVALGTYLPAPAVVDGEDYDSLVLTRNTRRLSVRTRIGMVVEWRR